MQPQFGAAILLLRNPYHALLSEWNRRRSKQMLTDGKRNKTKTLRKILPNETLPTTRGMFSHIGTVDQQLFGKS